MAKKMIFLCVLIASLINLFGIVNSAMAFGVPVGSCLASKCMPGDTYFTACGISYLQKHVCGTCSYSAEVCVDYPYCNDYGNVIIAGTDWSDDGVCQSYSNECSLGQINTRVCSTEVGVGTQTRTCGTIYSGGTNYYMWSAYSKCSYTSCASPDDVLSGGKCYCKTYCEMPNGHGSEISQIRISTYCPITPTDDPDLPEA